MDHRGFTLLEMLLSITMLVLIAVILGGALHMAQSALERGEKKVHYLQRMKVSYLLLESQIQSLMPYQTDSDGKKNIYFTGSTDKLMFFSNCSIGSNVKGNVLVTYEVGPDETGKLSLKVTERSPFQEIKDETTFLDHCEQIHFEYFLKNGMEEGKWLDNWSDSETSIPEKIRINLECGGKKISYLYSIFARPSEVTLSTLTGFKK